MISKSRKTILLTGKILLAALLLAWVLGQVHWSDYVVQGKKSFAVLDNRTAANGRQQVLASSGSLWWKSISWMDVSQFDRPDKDRTDQKLPAPLKYDEAKRLGVRSAMKGMVVWLLVLAFALDLISILVTAVRGWFLLKIQEIRLSLWEAIRLTFVGMFFNNAIPGTVGGDLIKAYYISKHTPRKAAVLVCVFVDRVLGLTELTLLAAVMIGVVLLTGVPFEQVRQPAIMLAVVITLVALAFAFLLSARFRRLFRLQKFYQRLPIAHHFAAAGDAAQLFRQRIGALMKAIAVTFGAHVLWITAIAMVGMSLQLPVPWYDYFLYIPLIYIVGAAIPTPGGVGGVEALYLKAFSAINPGINASIVIVLALLGRMIPLLWSLPGAIFAITGPRLPKTAAMEAELGMAVRQNQDK